MNGLMFLLHMMVTFLSFYINGELDHYEPATISVNSSLTIIGQYLLDDPDIGAREPWNGYLDNIEVWHIALSQQEIQQFMVSSVRI